MKKEWLSAFDWNVIVATNRQLCVIGNALHRPTSDGYETTRALWESTHRQPLTLAEVTDLCRRCHRLAPFCNFNGNTFVTIIRKVIGSLPLPADQVTVLRSLAGHIVAGIATAEERRAFLEVLSKLSTDEN
jgi:hypothetical protein